MFYYIFTYYYIIINRLKYLVGLNTGSIHLDHMIWLEYLLLRGHEYTFITRPISDRPGIDLPLMQVVYIEIIFHD